MGATIIDIETAGEVRFEPTGQASSAHQQATLQPAAVKQMKAAAFAPIEAELAGAHFSVFANTSALHVTLTPQMPTHIILDYTRSMMRSNIVPQDKPFACLNADATEEGGTPQAKEYLAKLKAARAKDVAVRIDSNQPLNYYCSRFPSIFPSGRAYVEPVFGFLGNAKGEPFGIVRDGSGNTMTITLPAIVNGTPGNLILDLKAIRGKARTSHY